MITNSIDHIKFISHTLYYVINIHRLGLGLLFLLQILNTTSMRNFAIQIKHAFI